MGNSRAELTPRERTVHSGWREPSSLVVESKPVVGLDDVPTEVVNG